MAPVTSLYAALGGLLIMLLVFAVVRQRRRAKVGIGDGGDAALARCIRAHGNAVETLPIGLLLLLLLELGQHSAALLHILGASLLLGRMLHAWGITHRSGPSFGRFHGMLLTVLVVAVMAALLLWQAASALAQ